MANRSKFHMTGELTLRGITQPVSVAIVLRPEEEGHQRIDGQFSFNRREFGMVHNVPFNKVGNTVEVNFPIGSAEYGRRGAERKLSRADASDAAGNSRSPA